MRGVGKKARMWIEVIYAIAVIEWSSAYYMIFWMPGVELFAIAGSACSKSNLECIKDLALKGERQKYTTLAE